MARHEYFRIIVISVLVPSFFTKMYLFARANSNLSIVKKPTDVQKICSYKGSQDQITTLENCTLPKDPGQKCSNAEEKRAFYYSIQFGICQPFNYYGCGGNRNHFSTAAECKTACSSVILSAERGITSPQWIHADKCNATHLIPDGKYFECEVNGSTNETSCPENHNCVAGGICCPTKRLVCSLRDDSGTFAEGIDDRPRFAWSAEIKSCWRFSYYGAKGNYNNFPNFNKCVSFCSYNK